MPEKIDRYENVQMEIQDGKLVITCEIDESKVDADLSASGKSIVFATSGGATKVPGTDLKLNLTLYRPVR